MYGIAMGSFCVLRHKCAYRSHRTAAQSEEDERSAATVVGRYGLARTGSAAPWWPAAGADMLCAKEQKAEI